MANKLLNNFANFTALGFEEAADFFAKNNTVFTGNPVRKEFFQEMELPKQKTILVLGGSQGAHALNKIIGKSLAYLTDQSLKFIHITGKADLEFMKAYYEESAFSDNYEIYDYYENIYELFAQSSFVVSRAGASTLAEILTVGLPAILIPYPYATENHQFKNAQVLADLGIAEIFEEKSLDLMLFVKTLKKMLTDEVLQVHAREISEKFKNNNFSENLYKLCQQKKSKKY